MPRQLRSALHKKAKEKDPDAQFDNNELLNNLIEKTEKRLDEICRDMSQK
ncbi:hypothetical protein IJM86_03305 [bacterium]|nr:hypothetical protein [bacterium]